MEKFPSDRLLGGKSNRLGVREKEAILDRVLAAQKPAPKRWILPFSFAATAACAAIAFFLVPDAEFTAKGTGGAGLELSCQSAPCRVGDRLYFRMLDSTPGHLAAFAQTQSGKIVWFFPQDETSRTRLVTKGLFDEAPVLNDGLEGDVTVRILLTETPLTRAEIRARVDGGDKTLLTRSLHIGR